MFAGLLYYIHTAIPMVSIYASSGGSSCGIWLNLQDEYVFVFAAVLKQILKGGLQHKK